MTDCIPFISTNEIFVSNLIWLIRLIEIFQRGVSLLGGRVVDISLFPQYNLAISCGSISRNLRSNKDLRLHNQEFSASTIARFTSVSKFPGKVHRKRDFFHLFYQTSARERAGGGERRNWPVRPNVNKRFSNVFAQTWRSRNSRRKIF